MKTQLGKASTLGLVETHMGKDRKAWYLNAAGELLPIFRNTEEGKEWRRKLAAGKLTHTDWDLIPPRLRGVFEHARTVKNNEGEHMTGKEYGDIFTSAVSFSDFKKYLGAKKKNTMPGESGIRVDHIAA